MDRGAERAKRAILELRRKSRAEIDAETAVVWAWRAWAARELGLGADAVHYAGEAIEHAALSGDDRILRAVRRITSAE